MSEGLLVAVFAWSITQGDGIEAVVLLIRWGFLLYRKFYVSQPKDVTA